ncbi:ornithine cyclodeaminase family protein [Oceanobacillus luteolus]|uniref:Ornithine cyclodeaminase family protein n=1 Tax=Oceanobacillus luteolus TaxID=1274358 RepID=A0ABW4HPG7_9BACI
MLFLNERDIRESLTMEEAIDAIDDAYRLYESQKFQMPTRMKLTDEPNALIVMPCLTDDAIGTKLVTSFPNNEKLPTLHGLVVLNSSETGEIQAIMDGSFITGFRTGAIGGSAIRHLAPEDTKKIAIIGTGVQGLYQAIAASAIRPITDIYLYNRSAEKLDAFIGAFQSWVSAPITIHKTDRVEEAAANADVIITTTTSNTPVLTNDAEVLAGKLIVGIGSFLPTMREFPDELYSITDQIFIDSHDAVEESGDLITPLDNQWIKKEQIQTISSFIQQGGALTHQSDKSIIFKSTGMALFDVVVAKAIYEKAKQNDVGTFLR